MPTSDGIIKNHDLTSTQKNRKNVEIFKKHIKKLSYEESISELEIILTNLQDENISLDNIQNNYMKGHILVKHCEDLLQVVEHEVNEINPTLLDID